MKHTIYSLRDFKFELSEETMKEMKRLNETKNLSKMSDKDQSLDSFSFEKFEERKTIVFNKKKPGFLKLSLDAITSLSNDEDNNKISKVNLTKTLEKSKIISQIIFNYSTLIDPTENKSESTSKTGTRRTDLPWDNSNSFTLTCNFISLSAEFRKLLKDYINNCEKLEFAKYRSLEFSKSKKPRKNTTLSVSEFLHSPSNKVARSVARVGKSQERKNSLNY